MDMEIAKSKLKKILADNGDCVVVKKNKDGLIETKKVINKRIIVEGDNRELLKD